MDKATPEQAESKAAKTVSNIMRITMNLNKRIEMKDKETEKSGSDTDNTDTKADIIPITKGNVSTTDTNPKPGRCSVKTLNTQKVGEFLASSQQNIHAISSCMNDMDKIFKSINIKNPDENDTDKLYKKDDRFSRRSDEVRRGINPEYRNPEKAFLEDEFYTIQELSRGKRKIHKEIIQVINTNKKYIDSIQDRLEKIINQVDKELSKVRQKVKSYTNELDKIERNLGYENSMIYRIFKSNCTYFQREVTNSNEIINTAAQFVIKYKVTLAGYLSAIAATSSSQAA